MFNNFICEKKSKFKTKGKIVITKKTNHSTPENHIRWFNQTKTGFGITWPNPTKTVWPGQNWTNPTLRYKILKKQYQLYSTYTKTNLCPNFFRIFRLKLTVNPVPGFNWIISVNEDQKPWTGCSVNPGLTLSIFIPRFSLFLSR